MLFGTLFCLPPSVGFSFFLFSFLSFVFLRRNFFRCVNSIDTPVDDLSERIMGPSQAKPNSASMADRVLADVSPLTHRNRQLTWSNDPQRYLEIFRFLLTSSIFPDWGRPMGPDSGGITSRLDARGGIFHGAQGKIDFSN